MRRPVPLRNGITALVAAVGLLSAGCASRTTQTTTAGGPAMPLVHAQKATGAPITIGFVNSEAGAFSAPELGVGSKVAVDYVNNTLGGVGNRPLNVVRCLADGSPEKSIDCANKFVEAKVAVVVEGVDVGSDAMLPILAAAKIPLVGHVQFGPQQMFDRNSFFFGAASLAYGEGALRYYGGQHAKKVEWFFPDVPSSHAFTDGVLKPTAATLGIAYKTIYYDAASPNWSVLAATATSDRADVSGAIAATDGQCVSMVRALNGAGYTGHILASSCFGLPKALGPLAAGVDVNFDHVAQTAPGDAPADKLAQIAIYTDVMKAAGHGDLVATNAAIAFADTITLTNVLKTIQGEVNGTSVTAALNTTKGLDSFLGPKITCDHGWKGNSACSSMLYFYRIQIDGSLKAAMQIDVASPAA